MSQQRESASKRFVSGMGNIAWGIRMTLTRRRLFTKSMIVIAINIVVYSGLLGAGWHYLDPVTSYLTELLPATWRGGWVYSTISFLLAVVWMILSVFAAIGLCSLITAPILDQLSEETERLLTGTVEPPPFRIRSMIYELIVLIAMLIYSSGFCLMATLFLGWIPVIGQAIPFCIGALFVSFNFMAPTAVRHGLGLRDRIRLIRRNRMTLIGFGAPVSVFPFLLVPVLTPALVVAGTRIFLQLAVRNSTAHRLTTDQLQTLTATPDASRIV